MTPRRPSLALALFLAPALASAVSAITIEHSGYLLDGADQPFTGALALRFDLYDASAGGTLVWQGQCASVAVQKGYYAVSLGSAACPGTGAGGTDATLDTGDLPPSGARFLAVTVGTTTLTPRVPLAPVATAARARDADTVGGRPASDFALAASTVSSQWATNGTAISYAGGNVGIGSSAPGQKLTVAGTVESTTGGFRFPDGTTQTTAASGTNVWAAAAGNISYVGGNVGIDTANPQVRLHVNAGTDANFITWGWSPFGGGGVRLQSTNDAFTATKSLTFSASDYSFIKNDGSHSIYVDGAGSVGIGTTTLPTRLTVAGTTTTTGLVTQTLKVTGGVLTAGHVLTSDAAGNAAWAAPTGGTGGGLPNCLDGQTIVRQGGVWVCQGITGAGGVITQVGGRTVHTFVASGAFTMGPVSGTIDVEVLGGGGGGGSGASAWAHGGGGGGYVRVNFGAVAGQTYQVVVGAGGPGQTLCNNSYTGTPGGASSFATLVHAYGGGGGATGGVAGAGGSFAHSGTISLIASGAGTNGGALPNEYNGYGGNNGGGTTFGTGAAGVPNYTPGIHAGGNGNGGGGGPSCQNGHRGGGNGSPGLVLIRY